MAEQKKKEHEETLVELDIEYKKLAEKNGCSFYKRVPALGIEENFIMGLTELVLQKETRSKKQYVKNTKKAKVKLKK